MKENKLKDFYEIPELEIRVSSSWIRFIRFCQVNIPHGQVCIKTANGNPTDLVPEYTKRRVRFDKEESIPTEIIEPAQF